MEREQFAALMPIIVGDLVAKIVQEEGIADDAAIERLYGSKLYSLLEQEDTKLWQYSTPMLYELYTEEAETGKITFPDV